MHRMMITDICQRTLTGRQRSSELRGKDKPKNKQLSIFLSQMEAFVLIIFQLFLQHENWEYCSDIPQF